MVSSSNNDTGGSKTALITIATDPHSNYKGSLLPKPEENQLVNGHPQDTANLTIASAQDASSVSSISLYVAFLLSMHM